MFLNVKGCFGSGKTTLTTGLIEVLKAHGGSQSPFKLTPAKLGKETYFAEVFSDVTGLKKPVVFLGKYGTAATGGCDVLNWKGAHQDVEEFIFANIDKYHIVGEGSIMSGTKRYNRIGVKLKEMGIDSWYGAMATPLDECIRRVIGRRQKKYDKLIAAGKPAILKELNPKGVIALYESVKEVAQDAVNSGLKVEYPESTPEWSAKLYEMLKEDDAKLK